MPKPGESDIADGVLVELDKQETFIRQLARRVDRGDSETHLIELAISRNLHNAFDYIHNNRDATHENPPLPDPVYVVLARAKAQALEIEELAARVKHLGGNTDVEAISQRLQRARDGMGHRLESMVSDNPAITRTWVAQDFHEVVFNPQQEILLELDEDLTRVEMAGGQ